MKLKYLHQDAAHMNHVYESHQYAGSLALMKKSSVKNYFQWCLPTLISLFAFLLLASYGTIAEAASDTYNSGAGNWIAPPGVTSVTVECWGGGGGGGGSNANPGAGGGAAGGQYATKVIAVTPGNSYAYSVGAGGTVASGANGNAGGNSTFITNQVVAVGGAGGVFDGAGATGSVTGGIGTTVRAGGNGAAGVLAGSSGGGGGGAGSGGTGGNASGGTFGAGGVGIAPGGNGGAGLSTAGAGGVGIAPGGGGGGGKSTGAANQAGGVGGAGRVVITYATDSLTAANTALASSAAPGATNVQMQRIQLSCSTGGDNNCIVTSATVDDLFISAAGTISNMIVHIDADTTFGGALGSVTTSSWNGQSTVVDLTSIAVGSRTIVNGTPKYLWITYDLNAGAPNGTQIQSSVTAIGVLSPDTTPSGGPWNSSVITLATGLTCSACHTDPPTDGTRNATTGAVAGDHAKHVAIYSYTCDTCHVASGAYSSRHRNGNIQLLAAIGGVINARYDRGPAGDHVADTSWAQTATVTLGKCENTTCHGGTNAANFYGGPAGAGPTWGTDSSAGSCTFCHNKAKTNSGLAADSYPVATTSPFRSASAAGAHAQHMASTSSMMSGGVLCVDCHTSYATVDAVGHIDSNLAAPADVPFPVGSGAYLNSTTPAYVAAGMTCTVYCHGAQMPKGDDSGSNRTPAWTATWTNYPTGCTATCHGLPPKTGASSSISAHATYTAGDLTTCKTCHDKTTTTNTALPTIDPVYHINGIVEATGCDGCHGGATAGSTSGTKNIWPDDVRVHTANQSGRHLKHMTALAARAFGLTVDGLLNDASSATKQKQLCDYCHQASTNDVDHAAGTLPAEVFPSGTYAKMLNGAADTVTIASYQTVADTCSNVDCHNNKLTTDGTYGWYDAGISTCMMCHTLGGTNNPTSGLHNVVPSVTGITHDDTFGTGGTCASCHTMTTAMINATSGTHINSIFTGNGFTASPDFTSMGLSGAMYTASADNTGTCSSTGVNCHGNATASLNYRDDWKHEWVSTFNYYTTSAACGGCHGDWANNGTTWNTGVIHRTAANVQSNHGDGGTSYECKECHTLGDNPVVYPFTFGSNDWAPNAGETTSKHGNGLIEINNATGTVYNTTTGLCNSACHGTTADGVHNFLDTSWTTAWLVGSAAPSGTGHAAGANCKGCHATAQGTKRGIQAEFNGTYNHGPDSTSAWTTIANADCEACHDETTGPDGVVNLKVVGGTTVNVTWAATYTQAALASMNSPCLSCHDGAGTSIMGVAPTTRDNINTLWSATTTTSHTYLATTNAPPQKTKARSAHAAPATNALKDETGRTGYTGAVACLECHPSHGSSVKSPDSAKGNLAVVGNMMKTGYSEPGTCWGCHDAAGVKDYMGDSTTAGTHWTGTKKSAFAYKQRAFLSTHEVNGAGQGFTCSVCHNPHGTTAGPQYYTPMLRGTWMTSPYPEDRTGKSGATDTKYKGLINGPRIESTLAYNKPANWGLGYGASGGTGNDGYFIDDNTFGTTAVYGTAPAAPTHITQTVDQFGGLCASCHTSATWAGGTTTAMKTYLDTTTFATGWGASVHNAVSGWSDGTTNCLNATNQPRMHVLTSANTETVRAIQNTTYFSPRSGYSWASNQNVTAIQAGYHAFPCSKCHTPHANSLPKLMVTNCLDVGTTAGSRKAHGTEPAYTLPTYSTFSGSGVTLSKDAAMHCHNNNKLNTSAGGGWNKVTGW